jgi:hypothetical protein
VVAKERRPQDWTAEQQLLALHETHGLSDEALQTWCRENSLSIKFFIAIMSGSSL